MNSKRREIFVLDSRVVPRVNFWVGSGAVVVVVGVVVALVVVVGVVLALVVVVVVVRTH